MVENKKILAEIKYLRKFSHMGNLELFHSVLNKYCSKRLYFTLQGMIARTQLAVLEYNCGSNIRNKRSRIHTQVIIFHNASPDTTGDKLSRIGSILLNIAPIENPDKEKAIENTKTRFKILFYFLKNTFIYKIVAKHFYYIMNIVFVYCSVYLHFIFYTMTITKLQNEIYILLKRKYKFY